MVAERAQHGLHGLIHLHLLCVLLPEPVLHERPGADLRVLRLLPAHGVRLLAHAGQRVVLGFAGVHPPHLPKPQNGLGGKSRRRTHVGCLPPPAPFFVFVSRSAIRNIDTSAFGVRLEVFDLTSSP